MNRIVFVFACVLHATLARAGYAAVTYNVPPDPIPATLAPGDVLNYDPGVALYDSLPAPAGATVNIYSGAADLPHQWVEAALNVIGGSVSSPFSARDTVVTIGPAGRVSDFGLFRSHLQINGGLVNLELFAVDSVIEMNGGLISILGSIAGSELTMSDGLLGFSWSPLVDGTLNVNGGVVGDLGIGNGVVMNLAGGQVGAAPSKSDFTAYPGSRINLVVQQAMIDGTPIPGLVFGSPVAVDVTNMTGDLSGILRDGSLFHFDLVPVDFSSGTYPRDPTIITDPTKPAPGQAAIVNRVEVYVTLVPEPASGLLLLVAASGAIRSVRRRPAAIAHNLSDSGTI